MTTWESTCDPHYPNYYCSSTENAEDSRLLFTGSTAASTTPTSEP